VAINALSGAVDILTYEEGLALEALIHGSRESACLESERWAFLNHLRDRGYIFPSREIEDLFFESMVGRYKNLKARTDRILGFFSIDTECPMKCAYCFEKKNEDQFNGSERSLMTPESLEAAFKALDLLKGLQDKEIEFVAGWGGEPLQEKNYGINEQFLALARDGALPVAYFSNMAMMGPRLIHLLQENASGIKFVSTTLDGIPAYHDKLRNIPGSFHRTVASITACLGAGLNVAVRTNIGSGNMHYLPDLAAFYESQGWFDALGFTAFVTPAHDRQHDCDKSLTLPEQEIMSRWLRMRDAFPLVRKIKTLKIAPSLYRIIKAFEPEQVVDLRDTDLQGNVKPMLTYCAAENRTEYVFTGAPNYSVYICAECTGLSKFRIGRYRPNLSFDPEKRRMWGIEENFHAVRSIDRLSKCRTCRVATLCGGYCALEAIVENGCSDNVFCKNAEDIITTFVGMESARLYRKSTAFLGGSANDGRYR
jgi:radical SAM protein with 4Fe4S-binding SPASM domain